MDMNDPARSADLRARFDLMDRAAKPENAPDWRLRAERLRALQALVQTQRRRFGQAIAQDFGQRPLAETDLAEVFPALQAIRHALRHGKGWMRRRPVATPLWFRPARSWVQPRPLGTVGIVAPWNYPLYLSVAPLASAFVAGNRAMLKLSEHAPAFAEAFAEAAAQRFDPEVLAVILGGPETAAGFCALPFDHLLFTGSTATGRQVMRAAADNLVPVTLELGGKSPALLAPDARLEQAVARIMTGKLLNAGQTCVAPDYLLPPRGAEGRFIALARDWVARHYPKLAANPDYSHIINDRQYQRLADALAQAQAAGATLHPLSDAPPDAARRLMPPMIVTDAAGPLAEAEIFGPILPLIPYDRLDDALRHIQARPRPLAFYPFTESAETRDLLLGAVVAGGVTVNDTLMHVAGGALPFGGVGASGMGAYHGQAGFDRLSHLMPVMAQARRNAAGLLAPPYRARFRTLIGWMMRL